LPLASDQWAPGDGTTLRTNHWQAISGAIDHQTPESGTAVLSRVRGAPATNVDVTAELPSYRYTHLRAHEQQVRAAVPAFQASLPSIGAARSSISSDQNGQVQAPGPRGPPGESLYGTSAQHVKKVSKIPIRAGKGLPGPNVEYRTEALGATDVITVGSRNVACLGYTYTVQAGR
jgi:hypothetical protein